MQQRFYLTGFPCIAGEDIPAGSLVKIDSGVIKLTTSATDIPVGIADYAAAKGQTVAVCGNGSTTCVRVAATNGTAIAPGAWVVATATPGAASVGGSDEGTGIGRVVAAVLNSTDIATGEHLVDVNVNITPADQN